MRLHRTRTSAYGRKQIELRCGENRVRQRGGDVEQRRGWQVVRGDAKGECILDPNMELSQIIRTQTVVLADRDNAVDVLVADAWDAKQGLARRGVDVDGKELRVCFGPGRLWILRQRERGILRRGEFGGLKAVEAYEPVGLVEAVLADERRRLERQTRIGFRVRGKARVVDTA